MSDVPNPYWQEVEQAFAAVLELPDEQKEACLAQLPAPIRAEVESLLEAYRRSDGFFGYGLGRPSSPQPTRI